MIEYSADGKIAIYDGYKFRRDPNTGYFLCTKKTDAGKRERLHVYVFRRANGAIPDGYHVHHIDEDKNNNEPENLALLAAVEHTAIHSRERWEADRDRMAKSLAINAVPAATAWHKSAEGRKWHSAHQKEILERAQEQEYVCTRCGKRYKALPIGKAKKFCSNACRAAARRESGVDNEKRFCRFCGEEFTTNKYSGAHFCSGGCAASFRWSEKRKASGARASI